MKYVLKKFNKKPFLYSKNNIVAEVNNEFMNFTGYFEKDLIGKSLTEISCMLKIDSQIYLENIENEYSCHMFTKEYEPREITISCKSLKCKNEKIYFIKETPNSSVKEKFDFVKQLYTDSKTGYSIISVPDLILLKVNQNYLNTLDEPYNKMDNSIGKKHKEIITGYECSEAEEIWKSVITTGKPYHVEEFQHNYFNRGVTYWNLAIVPIFVEGNLKYIINKMLDVTEKVLDRKLLHKQVEIIKEQKEQLEAVIDNVSDGVFILNKEGKHIKVKSKTIDICPNDSIKYLGDSRKINKYFDMLGNEITIENMPITRALNGEKVKNEKILVKSFSKEQTIEFNATPIFDVNGNITMGAVFYNDITDLYNKEKIIKEQKDKLEVIIENISDKLIIFDKDGNITRVNKSSINYILNCKEVKNVNDYFKYAQIFDMDGNLISKENSAFSRILNGENLVRDQVVVKTNNKVTYTESNGNAIYDSKGNFIAGVLLIQDVTNRLKSDETLLLKTQYKTLHTIIENLDLRCTIASYPDLNINYINNKYYMRLKKIDSQIELSTIMGGNVFDIFKYNICEKTKAEIKIRNLMKKKSNSCFYYKKSIELGQEKFFKVMCQPIFGLNNEVREVVFIGIDITEEIKAKNKMEKTLKAQDEIFSNISHELKTPLNVIFSTNQLMEFYLKNDSLEANDKKVSNGINIIKQNCYRFTKLINNIMDISKIESGFLKLNLSNENIVNITEDIVQSVSDYIKVKGLNIIFDTNTEEKIIACDPDEIERIILNLISNAIKFTNASGNIFVNILDKGDTVEISVKDTGIGMDKKHLNNIFKRFHQVDKSLSRNAEGSGIGLFLVKSIVKLHGGKISAESKLNEGSIFKIELPARRIKNPKVIEQSKPMNSKIEMINIEFSDIY